MKTNLLTKAAAALLISSALIFTSCGNSSNHQHNHSEEEQTASTNSPQFENAEANTVYHHYIHLKTALVDNNEAEAAKASEELLNALNAANQTDIAAIATDIKAAQNINDKRAFFNNLSESITTYVKANKLTSGIIYKQYCPMANDDNGGTWLANEKEVRNPYYGDQMLKCGSVEEEIK